MISLNIQVLLSAILLMGSSAATGEPLSTCKGDEMNVRQTSLMDERRDCAKAFSRRSKSTAWMLEFEKDLICNESCRKIIEAVNDGTYPNCMEPADTKVDSNGAPTFTFPLKDDVPMGAITPFDVACTKDFDTSVECMVSTMEVCENYTPREYRECTDVDMQMFRDNLEFTQQCMARFTTTSGETFRRVMVDSAYVTHYRDAGNRMYTMDQDAAIGAINDIACSVECQKVLEFAMDEHYPFCYPSVNQTDMDLILVDFNDKVSVAQGFPSYEFTQLDDHGDLLRLQLQKDVCAQS